MLLRLDRALLELFAFRGRKMTAYRTAKAKYGFGRDKGSYVGLGVLQQRIEDFVFPTRLCRSPDDNPHGATRSRLSGS